MRHLIQKLTQTGDLSDSELLTLLQNIGQPDFDAHRQLLFDNAKAAAVGTFGNKIYVRGLIEFTNYCKNNCYYCGIRAGNARALRYRLTPEDIFECCREGYRLGLRTFVLQGGEDMTFSALDIRDIVAFIHRQFPDCAITLSIGERSPEDYQMWFDAGANRFLLRHETADTDHYRQLHPNPLSLEHRMACLRTLKAIGYQTGTGFMVGSPGQTARCLVKDLRFIKMLGPEMIGIGPFIPHKDTPLGAEPAGTLKQTLILIAILRLMHPQALIPATTALGTIAENGREQGILCGANVVMPNLSPSPVRKKYMLYDNKLSDGAEAAQNLNTLNRRFKAIGYEIDFSRGDHPSRKTTAIHTPQEKESNYV